MKILVTGFTPFGGEQINLGEGHEFRFLFHCSMRF